MDAWETLKDKSLLSAGDAWENLNAQSGGNVPVLVDAIMSADVIDVVSSSLIIEKHEAVIVDIFSSDVNEELLSASINDVVMTADLISEV